MPRLFDFKRVEPVDTGTGKGWINPRTGEILMRLGSSWIPFAGAAPETEYTTTIYMRGVNRSAGVRKGSLQIQDHLTSKLDTLTLIYDDMDGTFQPQHGDEIIVYRDDVKIFGGIVNVIPQTRISVGKFAYQVKAVDYSYFLGKRRAVESYTSQLAGDIIKDLVSKYAVELTTNNVSDGVVIDFISFNYKTPLQAIKEIAKIIGYDWYVDYDLDIHFFPSNTNAAPFDLDETASSGRYRNLQITVDKTQLRNRVIVRGGFFLSNLYTQEIVADGEQTEFVLAYTPREPVSVFVNDTSKTLGVDNLESSGFDFLLNTLEKLVKNLDEPKLSNGDVFKATYKYRVPILVQVDDEASQETIRSLEGGDGVYVGPLIVDESLSTLEAARERGLADIRDFANPLIEGEFITDQDGYRSGQILTVDLPSRGYANKQYLVQSVTKKSLGLGFFEYKVKFATKLKGLTDFLMELFQSGQKIIEREDEVLDELAQHSSAVAVATSPATFEEHTPPFQYGPGGSPQGVWNESQWG